MSLPSNDGLDRAEAKRMARRLQAAFADRGAPATLAAAYESLAGVFGHADWNTMSALLVDRVPRPVSSVDALGYLVAPCPFVEEDDISVELGLTWLCGQSGSGKSTLASGWFDRVRTSGRRLWFGYSSRLDCSHGDERAFPASSDRWLADVPAGGASTRWAIPCSQSPQALGAAAMAILSLLDRRGGFATGDVVLVDDLASCFAWNDPIVSAKLTDLHRDARRRGYSVLCVSQDYAPPSVRGGGGGVSMVSRHVAPWFDSSFACSAPFPKETSAAMDRARSTLCDSASLVWVRHPASVSGDRRSAIVGRRVVRF